MFLKAVVKVARGVGNVYLKEVEVPKIASDEVLVKVISTGICGTDIHIYGDTAFYEPPVIMGHEYSGVIVEKGSGVQEFKHGDRVTSPATLACGKCILCRTNHANRCLGEEKRILGAYRANGTFAKYVAVPSRILHRIPDSLSFDDAAVAEPAACVVHNISETVGVSTNDTVLVLGPGPTGLLAVQLSKLSGAGKVVIAGMSADKDRLKLALDLGADISVNVEEEELGNIVGSLTAGLGVDVVFEASGASGARRQALQLVRRCGKVGLLGLAGRPTDINLDLIVEGELSIRGTWGTVWSSWHKALELLGTGRLKVAPLITAKLPLGKWKEGFRMMEERKAMKVLLVPS